MIAAKLDRDLLPWQRDVIDVALERVDGPGSPFAYDQVITIVGRRSGKTVAALSVALIRALAGQVHLPDGRIKPFRAAHTAQNLIAARRRFIEDIAKPYETVIIDEGRPFKPANHIFTNFALTSMRIDPKGVDASAAEASEIQVYAPTANGLRSAGLPHLTLDEALVFSREEGAALQEAARPTMAEYGGQAQQWITTNISARTDETRWITELRDKGRAAVASDRRTGVAYTEFSMPSDGDPSDESLWWQHHPGLADGLVSIDALRRDLEELKPGPFAAEYLGLWPDTGDAVRAWAAIPPSVFDAAAVAEVDPAAPVLALGVDVDPFGRAATIVAATGERDHVVVEVIAHGEGSGWALETVRERARQTGAVVVIDDYGPGHELLLNLEGDTRVTTLALGVRDASAACYSFEASLGTGVVRYWPNDALRDAVAAANRTAGRSWVYERRLDVVQTPLLASVLALWGAQRAPVAIAPAIY